MYKQNFCMFESPYKNDKFFVTYAEVSWFFDEKSTYSGFLKVWSNKGREMNHWPVSR